MRSSALRAAAALAAWLAASPAVLASDLPACSRRFTLAYHDHGLLYSKRADQGIDKDVAAELIRRSGCQFKVTVMPRARIWRLIESGELDFSMSGITNPAREKFASFAWYLYNRYDLLVRRDAGAHSLAAFLDDPKLQLGQIRSFRYSPSLNALADRVQAQGRSVEVADHAQLLQMMKLNRIQAMIIEPFNYSQVEARELAGLTVAIDPGDPPTLHGLIMSRKALPEAEQARWRALVDGMRRDGTLLKILQKYFEPALARSMVTF